MSTVSLDGDEYRWKIFPLSMVGIALYPVGIPLFLYLSLRSAGVPDMVKQKLKTARFAGMLQYRNRQLNSVTRNYCVFSGNFSCADLRPFSP